MTLVCKRGRGVAVCHGYQRAFKAARLVGSWSMEEGRQTSHGRALGRRRVMER